MAKGLCIFHQDLGRQALRKLLERVRAQGYSNSKRPSSNIRERKEKACSYAKEANKTPDKEACGQASACS